MFVLYFISDNFWDLTLYHAPVLTREFVSEKAVKFDFNVMNFVSFWMRMS